MHCVGNLTEENSSVYLNCLTTCECLKYVENTVTCRPFLGNNSVQNTFPWRWIPGYSLRHNKGFRVNEDSTKVSVDTKEQQTFS
jgi:hypothetical protein